MSSVQPACLSAAALYCTDGEASITDVADETGIARMAVPFVGWSAGFLTMTATNHQAAMSLPMKRGWDRISPKLEGRRRSNALLRCGR